jgi:hypothetical protein
VAPSALFNKPTEHPMSQPFDASKSLGTLEQDNTVIAVIEMSQSKWLVAAVVPGVKRQPLKNQTALERGRDRLGSISKQGDRYLRSLFVAGALAVIRYAKIHGTKYRPWVAALLTRRPTKVAAIALANKLARMAWAMMARASDIIPASLRV